MKGEYYGTEADLWNAEKFYIFAIQFVFLYFKI